MSFRLVPKSVTLNNLKRHNGVISANSGSFRVQCMRKSSRSVCGNWTTRGYANSRIANSRTGQLAVLDAAKKEN